MTERCKFVTIQEKQPGLSRLVDECPTLGQWDQSKCQACTVASSLEIGAGPDHRKPMEIPGYRRSLLPVLKHCKPI